MASPWRGRPKDKSIIPERDSARLNPSTLNLSTLNLSTLNLSTLNLSQQ